ncbi:MAG: hypothetical protein ACE5I7_20195 [Candidatus Binatia bacterium]
MRAFGSNGYLLRDARLEVRLVYTAFLLLALIGMVTTAAFQLHHIGPTPRRAAAYYRGGEVGGQMSFPKTFRQLVEATHFHAFVMGLVYLVLAHLFIATTVSPVLKQWLIVLAFGGLVGDLASPWLICYGSSAFAHLLLVSWLAEWVGFGAFVAVPVRDMWFSQAGAEIPPE